ncbi:hypothetical protein FRX31_017837 [Thalictrum thalictroides]|uniref:Transmembrane protein n=1 Tax=Thalictrum thalictroides TaxID=46969 RepID=A0A7J6W5V4_THATH|nr:hypothetical protein FRX31_017837 [Thalictrum thalictroides]
MQLVQEVVANQNIHQTVIEGLTVAAKQSMKKSLPKIVCGTTIGVGSVIIGMAGWMRCCNTSSIPEAPEI